MAVKLRLRREGSKKKPHYRVVAADSRAPRNGRFLEIIGDYHPMQDPSGITLDGARALHWLQQGARPTSAVRKLLRITGVWEVFESGGTAEDLPAPPEPEEADTGAAGAEEAKPEEADTKPEAGAPGESTDEAEPAPAADVETGAEEDTEAQDAAETGAGEGDAPAEAEHKSAAAAGDPAAGAADEGDTASGDVDEEAGA